MTQVPRGWKKEGQVRPGVTSSVCIVRDKSIMVKAEHAVDVSESYQNYCKWEKQPIVYIYTLAYFTIETYDIQRWEVGSFL